MPPQVQKPKKTSPWKRFAGGLFYLVVCTVALALGTGMQWVKSSPVMWESFVQTLTQATPEEVFENRDSITLLILGCDEDRVYGGAKVTKAFARSDTMLVAKIDFKNKKVGLVSIPRDLAISVQGYREQKINAYHVLGGPELAKEAAIAVVGVPIDRVITINYDSFKDMVDAAGGVEVYVEKHLKYKDVRGHLDIDLKPGRQKLNGEQAMGFVRFRHDAMSDFARQGRQKDFLMALKTSVQNNPTSFRDVVNEAENVLNGGLSSREVAALGIFMKGVPKDNIKMAMVPVVDGRGSNLELDHGKLAQVLAENYITPPIGGTTYSRR